MMYCGMLFIDRDQSGVARRGLAYIAASQHDMQMLWVMFSQLRTQVWLSRVFLEGGESSLEHLFVFSPHEQTLLMSSDLHVKWSHQHSQRLLR